MIECPSIYSYRDYRDFLFNFIMYKKELNSSISYSFFSRRLGISKPHLCRVIHKERHLSKDFLKKLATICQLNSSETKYLAIMIAYAQSDQEIYKDIYGNILDELKERSRRISKLVLTSS